MTQTQISNTDIDGTMHGLFITGTDTNVGKTYVTNLIARQLRAGQKRVGIYKPVCSGAELSPEGEQFWPDVESHFQALEGEFERERICPQNFKAPAAPPVAARMEQRTVDEGLLQEGFDWWRSQVDLLLVEGVGGFLCPLTEHLSIADFAIDLKLPVVIVAPLGLGTLNQTLLTIEAIRHRGLTPVGIVLNQHIASENTIAEESNPSELAARTEVPILACVQFGQLEVLRDSLTQGTIEWEGLAQSSSD